MVCSLLGECWEEEEEYTERLFILGLVHHPLSHILITHVLLFPTHCDTAAEKFFSVHGHCAEIQRKVALRTLWDRAEIQSEVPLRTLGLV